MTERDIRLLLAILFAVIVLSVRIVSADESEVLVLSKALVAEANWTASADHAAIAHVLQRRARQRGVSLATMCGLYVSVLRQRSGVYVVNTPRAQWIRGLTLDARKPNAWPASQSWTANAPRWLAVIDRARAAIAGTLADPCPTADHWGSPTDRPFRGLVRVDCGGTRNFFYEVTR